MVKDKKNYRLTKNEILRGRGNFDHVFKTGKKINGNHVLLFYCSKKEKRVGFAVSRRIKKAVDRNRQKRLLREIYRLNKGLFPDTHWLILLSKGTTDNYLILEKDLKKLIKKIGSK